MDGWGGGRNMKMDPCQLWETLEKDGIGFPPYVPWDPNGGLNNSEVTLAALSPLEIWLHSVPASAVR